jgi:hypothetical protein
MTRLGDMVQQSLGVQYVTMDAHTEVALSRVVVASM